MLALSPDVRSGLMKARSGPWEEMQPGSRGITLGKGEDEVIGMICVENENFDVLVVSENGYGKRSSLEDYRVTNRGGKGIKTINITSKTGNLIAIKECH